jgi:hypothetical protein
MQHCSQDIALNLNMSFLPFVAKLTLLLKEQQIQ